MNESAIAVLKKHTHLRVCFRYAFLCAILPSEYEHGGIRTPDPQNRNLMLYPLSYMPLLGKSIALFLH